MGRRIDVAAGVLAGTAALYLFFLNAWRSVPAACVCAFCCMALGRYVLARRPVRRKRRCSSAEAASALWRLTLLPEEEAMRTLRALLRRKYPEKAFALLPLLRLEEGRVTRGDVLCAWKAHRDAEDVLIAATCFADPRATAFARELTRPRVAIADRRTLARLLRAYGVPEPLRGPSASPGERLLRAFQRLAGVRVRPKSALYALSMLAMYLVTGHVLYLICALALLLACGAALFNGRFAGADF